MFGQKKQNAGEKRQAPELQCSFCNKSASDVCKLITGPNVNICNECVETCVDIMADDAHALEKRDAVEHHASGETNEDSRLIGRACAFCGLPLLSDEALPIEERGFLCLGCVGVIEAAIAERKLGE